MAEATTTSIKLKARNAKSDGEGPPSLPDLALASAVGGGGCGRRGCMGDDIRHEDGFFA
jgi:hypothetical protein